MKINDVIKNSLLKVFTCHFRQIHLRKGIVLLMLLVIHFIAQAQKEPPKTLEHLRTPLRDSTSVLEAMKLSRETHKKKHNEEAEYLYAQQALVEALELHDTLLYARALDNLGLLYRYHQQYLQSIPLHIKAFDLVKNLEVPPIYKMIFANNAGVAARYGEKYDLSVSWYLKALTIAEKENNLKNIAISCNGLGNALGNIPNRQEEALEYFNRALKTEEIQKNSRGVAMNLLSISDYYIDTKQFLPARQQLNQLMDLNRKLKDEHGMAITAEFFGLSYLREGKNYEKAHTYFQEAFSRFKNLEDKMKQAELLSLLGEARKLQQQNQEALSYYKKSQEITDSVANKGLIMANALNMAQIYESQNRPVEALHNYKLAQRFSDSINLHNQEIQIMALTKNHELEKKESQIEQLGIEKDRRTEEIKLQGEKIKNQQMILLLIVFSVISILAVFAMQLRNTKVKKKTTLLLEKQEQERLQAIYDRNLAQAEMLASRMKINPHFLFNCLNAINNLIQKGNNEKASKYLIEFSRFVRNVLETSKNTVIPIEEELALIRQYLVLEEKRFDNNFSYSITNKNEGEVKNIMIPPLLLQPFVENAIWHGLMPSKKDRKVLSIQVHKRDDFLEIIIEDNGVGRIKDKKFKPLQSHKSMGTEITQDRINLFNKSYKSKISCDTVDKIGENGAPAGTLIKLTLTHIETFMEAAQA